MKRTSKSIKTALVAILILTISITNAFAGELVNFEKLQKYTNNFEDIKGTDWFANDVINSYEAGLFKGKSENIFDPYGNITLAEAITLISRVHNIYNGGTGIIEDNDSSEWFSKYVDYAVDNKLLEPGEFSNLYANATRAEIAYLFCKAIDLNDLTKINNITSLPDVNENTKYKSEIFVLYNAGIFTGSDEYGTFNADTNVSRAETSAVINRVVNENNRRIVSLINEDSTVKIKEIDGYKVTSLSDAGEYIAAEMIKGNENIDMKEFRLIDENVSKSEVSDFLKDLLIEVRFQNPLIFGINSFVYNSSTDVLSVNYTCERNYQEQLQNSVAQRVKEISAEIIEPGMSYMDREIAINNYLCKIVEYDTEAAEYLIKTGQADTNSLNSFNAYGALNNGLAVCEGYSQAFKLLCDEADITSIVVTGQLDGIGHAWNRVLIEDKWYDVDVTNNDKENLFNSALNIPKQIADEYLIEDDYYITNDNLNSLERGTSEEYEYYTYIDKYVEKDDIYNYLVNNIKTNSTLTFRTNSDFTMTSLKKILTKVLDNIRGRSSASYITNFGVVHVDFEK